MMASYSKSRGAKHQVEYRLKSAPLKRSGPEEEFHNVPFVRLQPIELDRRDRRQVQAIDVCSVYKPALETPVARDGRPHKSRSDPIQYLVLRAADHGHEGEHEFSVGQRAIWRFAMDHDRAQVSAALFFHQPRAEFSRDMFDPVFMQDRKSVG